jgi:hypothetical protein
MSTIIPIPVFEIQDVPTGEELRAMRTGLNVSIDTTNEAIEELNSLEHPVRVLAERAEEAEAGAQDAQAATLLLKQQTDTALQATEAARDVTLGARTEAQEAETGSKAAEQGAIQALQATEAARDVTTGARDAAIAARDLSQDWAEKSTAPGGIGTKSAKTHAGDAGQSATASAASATLAGNWAESPSAPGGAGTKSAKTHATEAAASAATALTRLNDATAQAGIATAQAVIATTQAGLSAAAQAFLDPPVLAVAQRMASAGGVAERGLVRVQSFLERIQALGLPRPSFLWDPVSSVAGTSYAVLPEDGAGDLTVTRATIRTRHNRLGTLVDVANNVPGLDFDPITGVFRGVIIEPAVTSFAPTSENFASASWDKQGVTVSASVTSPRGTATAQPIIPSTDNVGHAITHTTTRASGVWTSSIHAQSAGYSHISLIAYVSATNWVRLTFNVVTGALTETLSGAGSTFTALSARPFQTTGFGYNRFGMSFNSAASNFAIGYAPANSATPAAGDFGWPEFAGDGTSGVRVFGAQLESGAVMTSYVPVSSASATRNADTIANTGVADLVGQTEGYMVLMCDLRRFASARQLSVSDGTQGNSFYFTTSTPDTVQIRIDNGGTTVFSRSQDGILVGMVAIGLSYRQNEAFMYVNGEKVSSTVSVSSYPATSRINVGSNHASAQHATYRAARVALGRQFITESQLQALTTL